MKRVLLSIFASGLCAGAMAIPAKPGLVAYTQPDGSVINIRIVGDEHGHMLYSEGGLLLVDNAGTLEYAGFDTNGYPKPSGMAAKVGNEAQARALSLQSEADLERWGRKIASVREERIGQMAMSRMLKTRVADQEETTDGDASRLVPFEFGRCESTFPVVGTQKGLVILVEYEDVAFDYGDYDYFYRMLNEEGFSDYGSLGSARDWFIENSDGQLMPEFDVYGPVKLPNARRYYGANNFTGEDIRPQEMAIHACDILDESVDFSKYDRDGDGVIDNVFIFYAGKGEHDSGVKEAVWPHSWDLVMAVPGQKFIYDGVQLNHYACTCEYPSGYKRPDGIGTFVHEFSHVMGLPDLYVTDYSSGFTPGAWSVMDTGPYNNEGLTPPNYSSYEKVALGWLDFKPFHEGKMEIHDLTATNEAYVLPTDSEKEFFFFENRQQLGNDKFLPGHGMLVWHVDYDQSAWSMNVVNNTSTHQRVDLIEADNMKTATSRASDSFPGTRNVTAFGFNTKPQLLSWSKQRLGFDLEDIEESADGVISFNAIPDNSAVDAVEAADSSEGIYYDLMGRRVANPDKGIYIHNGKKVLVK